MLDSPEGLEFGPGGHRLTQVAKIGAIRSIRVKGRFGSCTSLDLTESPRAHAWGSTEYWKICAYPTIALMLFNPHSEGLSTECHRMQGQCSFEAMFGTCLNSNGRYSTYLDPGRTVSGWYIGE
jgi:hypothetical protein